MNTPLIHQLLLGHMRNFIYVVEDPDSKQAAVIDPAWDLPPIYALLDERDLTLNAIWLTHGHHDHVNRLDALLETHPVPVYISEKEAPSLTPTCSQLKHTLDSDTLSVGTIKWHVIHTPGHTPGGQCFYHPGHLITGDTLFIDGCGRCDFENSDVHAMYESLTTIKSYPPNTRVYPGHKYHIKNTDLLEHQLTTNRFLTCHSMSEFIKERLG